MSSGWVLIGSGLDSAGEGEGEQRAPLALRASGLAERLDADDEGDLPTRITSSARDQDSGVIGYADVLTASREIRDAVAAVLGRDGRPLVVGGDCTVLPGALAGARVAEEGGKVGLVMVDAHLDAYDGRSSPSGECADMDLAIATGRGPEEMVALAGEGPIVDPADAVAVGYRPPSDLDSLEAEGVPMETELIDPRVEVVEARALGDPAALGERLGQRLGQRPGRFWLHLDADAIDPEMMAAVSYPEPGGLSWEQALQLISPLAASPALRGVSVADLNVDRDPDGACARRLVDLLAAALA